MNWENDRSILVESYYTLIENNNRELFKCLEKEFPNCKSIYPLIRFISDRISSVWLLTLEDRLWDADIIDRSVLEALIKLTFIIKAPNKVEHQNRLEEFWEKLWEIKSIKRSDQSTKMLNLFKDEISQLAHKPLVMTEKEIDSIKSKWSKIERKKLEQKWSFTEMIFDLVENNNGEQFEMLVGLLHEYRMCSHIAHADETGISIIEERKSRTTKDQADVHRGHFIKLMSNCLSYLTWCSITTMDHLNLDKSFYFKNFNEIKKIKPIEKKYQKEVFNDPGYDKYR